MTTPPDEAALAPPHWPAVIEHALDALIARFMGDADEVVHARAGYERRRGKIAVGEPLWERWSAAFVDWFVLERAGVDGRVPVAIAVAEADDAVLAATRRAWRALATSHRSLFELRGKHGARVHLIDLLGGGEFDVAEPRELHGVEVGDVAELRLVGLGGDVYFGRTFVFHPAASREPIAAIARARRADGQARHAIIDSVAQRRVRLEQYRHVPVAKVYVA